MLGLDGGMFLWVPLLLLAGLLGLVVGAVVLIVKIAHFFFARLVGGTDATHSGGPASAGHSRVCPNPRCGRLNPVRARYCGRCGTRMRATADVDAYG